MKVYLFVLFALLLFIISGCKKNSNYETSPSAPTVATEASAPTESRQGQGSSGLLMDSSNEKEEAPTSSSKEQQAKNASSHEKSNKIIKDGYLTLEVKEIEKVKRAIDTIIKEYKAYYENDQYQHSEYQSNYNLKIRIKANVFDQMVNNIMDIDGVVKNKNINARDVTDDYYDTEARLNSSKKYLTRYYDLLSKAKNIKDIMDIEEKIQQIQVEIDSYEGRLKYMDDQISYSTLHLTLTEDHEYYNPSTNNHFGKKIVNAFKTGTDILAGFLLVLITLWPLILMGLVIWLMRKRIVSLFKARGNKP